MAAARGIARFTCMHGENCTGARHVGKLGTLYNRDVFCETNVTSVLADFKVSFPFQNIAKCTQRMRRTILF